MHPGSATLLVFVLGLVLAFASDFLGAGATGAATTIGLVLLVAYDVFGLAPGARAGRRSGYPLALAIVIVSVATVFLALRTAVLRGPTAAAGRVGQDASLRLPSGGTYRLELRGEASADHSLAVDDRILTVSFHRVDSGGRWTFSRYGLPSRGSLPSSSRLSEAVEYVRADAGSTLEFRKGPGPIKVAAYRVPPRWLLVAAALLLLMVGLWADVAWRAGGDVARAASTPAFYALLVPEVVLPTGAAGVAIVLVPAVILGAGVGWGLSRFRRRVPGGPGPAGVARA